MLTIGIKSTKRSPLPRYIRQTSSLFLYTRQRNISKKVEERRKGSYFCVRLCVCGVTRVANERRDHISRGPISAIKKKNQIEAKNCITLCSDHVQQGNSWGQLGNTEIYLFSSHPPPPLLPTSTSIHIDQSSSSLTSFKRMAY